LDFTLPRGTNERPAVLRSRLRLVIGSSAMAGAALLLLSGPVAASGPVGDALDSVVEVTDTLGADELVDGVAGTVQPVIEPIQPALETVGATLDPVTEPILEPVAPVVEPVLDELEPVLDLLAPVADPITEPILGAEAPPAFELPELPILDEPSAIPGAGPSGRRTIAAPPLLAVDTMANRPAASATSAAGAAPPADPTALAGELISHGQADTTTAATAVSGLGGPRIGAAAGAVEAIGSITGSGISLVWAAALVVLMLPLLPRLRLIDLTLTLPSGRLVLTPAPPG
jgi:hypothetical protein